jgi:hypothetical protein
MAEVTKGLMTDIPTACETLGVGERHGSHEGECEIQ